MSERDVLFAIVFVAFVAILAAIGAVYFAWRDREKYNLAFITTRLQQPPNRSLSQNECKKGL